jgi:GT2 family glycosyltransferase
MLESTPNILISVPTRENIHAGTVGWLLVAMQDASTVGYNLGVHILCSPYPLECQRNNQIFDFLKEDKSYTHLFLLDSDNVPQRGTIEKFLDYDLDVVHAVGAALIEGKAIITAGWTQDEAKYKRYAVSDENAKGLQKVDGIGASGVLIKREVIEALEYPYFKVEYDDNDGTLILGEDYYFSRKIREAGFEIWADFDMKMQHFKTVAL